MIELYQSENKRLIDKVQKLYFSTEDFLDKKYFSEFNLTNFFNNK